MLGASRDRYRFESVLRRGARIHDARIIRSPNGDDRGPSLYCRCRVAVVPAPMGRFRRRLALETSDMQRRLYLATLVLLQIALIGCVSPALAQALLLETAPGLAPAGLPAVLQLLGTAATVVGTSIALAFPALALARHRRGGPLRFLGLPAWAAVLASCGSATMCAGFILLSLVPILHADDRMTAVLIARSLAAGGLALAAAGVVCAEVLRRSVSTARDSARSHTKSGRVEVTHPPELRTRAA
jgi:hypothetical protein